MNEPKKISRKYDEEQLRQELEAAEAEAARIEAEQETKKHRKKKTLTETAEMGLVEAESLPGGSTVYQLKPGMPTKYEKPSKSKAAYIDEIPGSDIPIKFLIEGFMEEGTFNSIIGPSKSGKSMFALQMCMALSCGIDFLGYPLHKCGVLYVDMELRANHIRSRIEMIRRYYNVPDARGPHIMALHDDFSNGRIDFPRVISDVRYFLSKNPDVKMVVFDCFYCWCTGGMNIPNNVKAHLLPLKAIADEFNISVCYVHHTTKEGIGKNPTPTDIINAGSGSAVHSRMVDTTYVIVPKGSSDVNFTLATAGRACSCGTMSLEKNLETYFCFHAETEETQEVVEVDENLCQKIYEDITVNDIVDARYVTKKYNVTTADLRLMGFVVDAHTHRISANPKILRLPCNNPFYGRPDPIMNKPPKAAASYNVVSEGPSDVSEAWGEVEK